MKSVIFWIVSIISFLLAASYAKTSVIAALILLIAGIYTAPFIRNKLPQSFKESLLFGGKATALIVVLIYGASIYMFSQASDREKKEELVKSYSSDPTLFIEKTRRKAETGQSFIVEDDLDSLISSFPSDQKLKDFRHELFIRDLKSNLSAGNFRASNIKKYQMSMGMDARMSEIELLIDVEISQKIPDLIKKGALSEAKSVVAELRAIFPESKLYSALDAEINSEKDKVSATVSSATSENKAFAVTSGMMYMRSKSDCDASTTVACVDEPTWKELCSRARGVTEKAKSSFSMLANGEEKALLKGGSIDSVMIFWVPAATDSFCAVNVDLSGVVDGTSAKTTTKGTVVRFIGVGGSNVSVDQIWY